MTMRTIDISGSSGRIMLTENEHDDTTTIDIDSTMDAAHSIELNSEQLYQLGEQIVSWFGGTVLRVDDRHKLREVIDRVMADNESRCLDDEIDRGVVVRELVKALGGSW